MHIKEIFSVQTDAGMNKSNCMASVISAEKDSAARIIILFSEGRITDTIAARSVIRRKKKKDT